MPYIKGYSTADNIVKDLTSNLINGSGVTNKWDLVYPANIADVTNTAVLKPVISVPQEWGVEDDLTVVAGTLIVGVDTVNIGIVTLAGTLSEGGNSRVYVKGKKYYLYRNTTSEDVVDLEEYRIVDGNKIIVHSSMVGKVLKVDYEKVTADNSNSYEEKGYTYYLKISKPSMTDDTVPVSNHYYVTLEIGDTYHNEGVFSSGHYQANASKLNWFAQNSEVYEIAGGNLGWMPVEYWINVTNISICGALRGDAGLSREWYQSSPFYCGKLNQIPGAMTTDIKGNFGLFTSSYTAPTLSKLFGDYTGTGVIDVVMAATKTGRPYNAHKVAMFGGYEFREKTINGTSYHTEKNSFSDIYVGDVNEGDRGMLNNMIAISKVGVEHNTELIYNRYEAGKEERYRFIELKANYTPFNTGPDSLTGIAIRIDD